MHNPLRFQYVLYPLWRKRDIPSWAKPLTDTIFRRFFPVDIDRNSPSNAEQMAKYLINYQILEGIGIDELRQRIADADVSIHDTIEDNSPDTHAGGLIRIPAQWEPIEKVLISWGGVYPPIWEMHAQMVEAITPVAKVEILVSSTLWARTIYAYLKVRGYAQLEQVHFLVLPTDDIWIRDYGPIVGVADNAKRVAIDMIYDPIPAYPQDADNNMARNWAGHNDLPLQAMDLHTEGGNLWSDGGGTLVMTDQIFYSNPQFDRKSLEAYLHTIIDFEKLIIIPRLVLEETGHVDLIVKLVSSDAILLSQGQSLTTGAILREVKEIFEQETNATGDVYRIFELPTPPLYLNWFTYTIRRAYTNSLTVNGRVLVPIYKIPTDEEALRVYETAMPDYEMIPIDCSQAINGGGAVHCMTKEIPSIS